MLTAEQKKRLAKEARKLAMECVNNGPIMSDLWCGCAIGTTIKRAGLWGDDHQGETLAMGLELSFSKIEAWPGSMGILSEATRLRVSYEGESTAVVFPLLAWADELEALAPSTPEKLETPHAK